MRFYSRQHQFYCGIDLHARCMYLCILDHDGNVRLHRNMPAAPEPFLSAIAPFREDRVIAAECIFTWAPARRPCSRCVPCPSPEPGDNWRAPRVQPAVRLGRHEGTDEFLGLEPA